MFALGNHEHQISCTTVAFSCTARTHLLCLAGLPEEPRGQWQEVTRRRKGQGNNKGVASVLEAARVTNKGHQTTPGCNPCGYLGMYPLEKCIIPRLTMCMCFLQRNLSMGESGPRKPNLPLGVKHDSKQQNQIPNKQFQKHLTTM